MTARAIHYASLSLAVALLTVPSPARLGSQPATGGAPGIALTALEKAWIAEHPVIRVGMAPAFPPYAMKDPSDKVVGIDPDILDLVARRTGLKFEIVYGAPWPKVQEEFKAGRLDMLMNMSKSAERERYINFTRPYNQAPVAIVTRSETPYILDPRQLAGTTVGIPRGYVGMKASILEYAPNAVIVEFDDAAAALKSVARGEITAVLGDIVNAAYQAKDLRLTNLRLGSVLPGDAPVFMGVRKELGPLPEIVDKAVAEITPLERRQIIDRWIGLDFTDHWWLKAFKIAAAIAAVAVLIFVVLLLRGRRLEAELVERRRLQAELEAAHTELARVSDEKSEMMRTVAHDLRNPITVFALSAELLELQIDPTNSEALGTIVTMQEAGKKMLTMVDELVDVHMLESGARKIHWLTVDLVALAQRAVTDLAEPARRKNITVEFSHAAPTMPVSSDAGALRHVVDNLLSNAIKYSPSDSLVRLDLQREATGYCVRVVDQGPGVKPEERDAIFEKYGVGSAAPTGGEKAVGLGLWIARRTMQDLHGKVWCESGAGSQGSVFAVFLPFAPPVGAT